jgi:hypothetical protein
VYELALCVAYNDSAKKEEFIHKHPEMDIDLLDSSIDFTKGDVAVQDMNHRPSLNSLRQSCIVIHPILISCFAE